MEAIETLIEDQYKKDNYRIIDNHTKNGLCYIYASSNALYKKDDGADFQKKVIEDDRYEWKHYRAGNKPEREIFIRDIFLSWYVKGINSRICDYEKLIEFLRECTKGYTVRCVGVSSGGYIGNIIAMGLEAEMCYCFSGQFSLRNHFDHLRKNIYLKEYLEKEGDYWYEYYRRLDACKNTKIIYVLPIRSEQDIEQYNFVKDNDVLIVIPVDEQEHGIAIYPFALAKFLSYSIADCEKLSAIEKSIGGGQSKLAISIKIGGCWKFFQYIIYRMLKKL